MIRLFQNQMITSGHNVLFERERQGSESFVSRSLQSWINIATWPSAVDQCMECAFNSTSQLTNPLSSRYSNTAYLP